MRIIYTPNSTAKLIENQYLKLEKPVSTLTKGQLVEKYALFLLNSDIKVLDAIATYAHNHPIAHPSQKTLARMTGLHSRTIRKSLTRLRELGLISSYQRWNDSLLYKMADIFLDFDVRRALSAVCPTFKFLCIFYLFSPLLMAEGHLENNLFINLPNQPTCNKYINHTSKRNASKNPTEECGMENDSGISLAIRNLAGIKLTRWGQIKLSAFPDEAILYAQQQLKRARKRPEEVFSWFFSVCNRWCRENNREPDWQRLESLKLRHNMPENPNMLLTDRGDEPVIGSQRVPQRGTGREKRREEVVMPTRRPEVVMPAKRELTLDEKIEEERKMLALRQNPLFKLMCGAMETTSDVFVKEVAVKMGALGMPTPEEIEARIAARKSLKGLRN